jgi:hypothetical protein
MGHARKSWNKRSQEKRCEASRHTSKTSNLQAYPAKRHMAMKRDSPALRTVNRATSNRPSHRASANMPRPAMRFPYTGTIEPQISSRS